jgi:hypothetical protein
VIGRRVLALVLTALTATAPLGAQVAAPASPRPSLEPARVAGEVVGGAYAGFLGFYVGRFVGERVGDVFRIDENGTAHRNIVLGFAYAGAAFGTAGTVYGIGSIGDQTGDFGAALLGTGVGFGVAVGLNRFICPPPAGRTPRAARCRIITDAIEVLLPAIGSTIAFNSTRRSTR